MLFRSLRALGFAPAVVQAASEQNFEFPRIDVGGNNSVSSLGQATFTTLRIQSSSVDNRFDLTKVMSKHVFKMGAQYRKLFMNFRQHGQPAETTGLDDREVHLRRLTGGNALAFLLHQQPQAQIMERRHRQCRGV